MFDYTQPDFWLFIASIIGGGAYAVYYFIKKKKANPMFELALLLVNVYKDRKVTAEEWLEVTTKIKEIIDLGITDPIVIPPLEPPIEPPPEPL